MFSVYAVLLFGESWLRLVADLSARSESRAEFLRTALRCPASWEPLLSELKHAKTLLSAGEAPEARRVLSQSVAQVLGEDADAGVRAASLQHALEDCAVGMGPPFVFLRCRTTETRSCEMRGRKCRSQPWKSRCECNIWRLDGSSMHTMSQLSITTPSSMILHGP